MPDINWSLHASQQVSPAIDQIDTAIKNLGTQTQGSFQQIFNNFAQADSIVNRFNVSIKNTVNSAKSADNGLGSLLHTITGFTAGRIASDIIEKIGHAAMDLASNLISQPAMLEGYANAYVRIFHSVEIAKTHMDEVLQFAARVPQGITEILKLDQQLSLITETTGDLKKKVGMDFDSIRQTIVDASSAMNKDVNTVGNAFIRVFQGASGMGINALQRMGLVSKQELADQGVEFAKNNTKILSSSDQVTAALLAIWQKKFGGMAEVQSNTFNGIISNIKDWGVRASAALGGDLFAEAKTHLKDFWDYIRQPEVMATLKDWGDILGRVGHAAWDAFQLALQGAQAFFGIIRPLTDALGNLLHMLPGGNDSGNGLFDPAATSAGKLNANLEDYQNIMDQNATSTAALENQLKELRYTAEDVDFAYTTQIDKLREQETIVQRIYELQKAQRNLLTDKASVTRDKALAVDIFNSEGKSAALRLPGEEQKVADDLDAMANTAQKNASADKITSIENEKKATDQNFKLQERNIQRQIDQLKAVADAATGSFNDYTDGQNQVITGSGKLDTALSTTQTFIDSLRDSIDKLTNSSSTLGTTWNTLVLPGLEKAPDKLNEVGKTAGDAAHMLGVDKGMAFVVIMLSSYLHALFDLIDVMIPVVADDIGTVASVITTFAAALIATFANTLKMISNIPNAIASGDSSKMFEGTMQVPDIGKAVTDAVGHMFGEGNPGQKAVAELDRRGKITSQATLQALADDPTIGFKGSASDPRAAGNQNEFPSSANDVRVSDGNGSTISVTVKSENTCPTCKKTEQLNLIRENRADIADILGQTIKQRTSR